MFKIRADSWDENDKKQVLLSVLGAPNGKKQYFCRRIWVLTARSIGNPVRFGGYARSCKLHKGLRHISH